ncbi:MAG: hypothetical protein ACLFOY_05695 [Desulfatibacillaceae bacterium]
MKPATEVVQGRKEIMALLNRSWTVVLRWIEAGAPIASIDGKWEADRESLLSWRREYIRRHMGRGGPKCE